MVSKAGRVPAAEVEAASVRAAEGEVESIRAARAEGGNQGPCSSMQCNGGVSPESQWLRLGRVQGAGY